MELFAKLREMKARAKQQIGHRTGNRTLVAEGRTEQAEAKLLRTKDRIRTVANEIRRRYR
ncbi:CsbD family protein [Herbidospora galbida]|uniref:CsbD family protein n=1 Tax=Herbidospora galbida TaxID=2575442 RepID=A0A4U3MMI3_9ACTN|nr:CsbD family protein [Herbidospora galbida]TKK90049.1 CsbD family protein [Herbidospora galbida]